LCGDDVKRVIIESPYAAANGHTVAEHEAYARRCMADSLARGEAPLASHLLYTGILADGDPDERKRGMEAGFAWTAVAELVVLYADLGISHGMKVGEVTAMAVADAVIRMLPGALGEADSIAEESFSMGLLEYPQYTRPREFRGMGVPEVLLGGHHAKIVQWRRLQAIEKTRQRRPDLLAEYLQRTAPPAGEEDRPGRQGDQS
ncbi:hypothetical protein LCGC14_1992080, partial [marine sediment metagenome]